MSLPAPFPFVETSGSPYQRGLQHGQAVPQRVAASIALYREQLLRRDVGEPQIRVLAQTMASCIERFDADYLAEMRGIADGAGVSLEDVIVINCRTEMMFGHDALVSNARLADEPGDGCTGLIVLPDASETGRLIHAHNWDWREECTETGIVLRMQRGDGPDLLMFTEAGSLARHGFNSAGVSLTGNFLWSDRDYTKRADVPLVLIRRKMLEAENLCQAMKLLWSVDRFCSNNLMLAQAGGEAVDLECAPDEIFWLTPENGFIVHANHWICPVARTKLRDLGPRANPDSIYRQRRVSARLSAARLEAPHRIGWDTVKAALADDFPAPDGVLRRPKPASHASISATVATTLMDPADRRMWVARKPYEGIQFAEYRL
ncbi:C45 family peptidase [Caballeronia sp. dw_19]|uniref:C45 family autoproteolytic acyltransferase/hydolase n=1 Tax=unclassified Caballeronia TaxID=2646786 RepID=UPI001BD21C4A|nr:C45 family peptidase [Caballeronia sp. dw_19]